MPNLTFKIFDLTFGANIYRWRHLLENGCFQFVLLIVKNYNFIYIYINKCFNYTYFIFSIMYIDLIYQLYTYISTNPENILRVNI